MTTTQPGPWPKCPTCGSTQRHCLRPSGHHAAAWHAPRVALWDALPEDVRTRLDRIIERPRVRVEPVPAATSNRPRFAMWCEHCTATYSNTVKTDVQEKAAGHRDLHRNGQIAGAR